MMNDNKNSKNHFKNVKGIILDLDGTLINSMPVIYAVIYKKLRRHGITLSHGRKIGQALFNKLSTSSLPQGKRMVPLLMYKVARAAGLDRIRSVIFVIEATILLGKAYDNAELFPGTVDVLKSLLNQNIKLGLVSMSSKKGINKILTRTKIQDFFSIVISRDEVTKQKPDPEAFMLVQQRFQVEPEAIVVIGDLPTDTLAANRAGMLSIAVTTGLAGPEWFQGSSTPTTIISSLTELESLFNPRSEL